MDVGRPPGIVVVLPGIGAGAHGHEPVSPIVVAHDASGPGKVRVERAMKDPHRSADGDVLVGSIERRQSKVDTPQP